MVEPVKNNVKRNRLFAIGFVVVLLAIMTPVLLNFSKDYSRSKNQLRQAKFRLQQSIELQQIVESDRADRRVMSEKVAARGVDFDLYSFTNAKLQQIKIQQNAKLTSKGQSFIGGGMQSVELVLTNIVKKKLVDILYVMYKGENLITVQRLNYLRPSRAGTGLDCQLTLVAPKG